MQLKLYNSSSKQIEEFQPINPNDVRIYSCGPTVYNYAHIGNMRAFLFTDFLQAVLRVVGGYPLRWVMNITNIDDKTIRNSNARSEWKAEMGEISDDVFVNLKNYTQFYENEFFEDLKKLHFNLDDFYAMPRATDFIPQMQDLIMRLLAKGLAYGSAGSIYFNVAKYRESQTYGVLKKIDFDNFRTGERIDADEYEREQVSDFVLWKGKKEGEPYWNFDIEGVSYAGRPGWHLECSAMEYDLLGLPFDIHTGGEDLKFPHHEDEIAQSVAAYGVNPTKYWCHNAFLEVESSKMSKSAGNFFTVSDLIERKLDTLDIRFAMLSAHYRSIYNFTFDDVAAARKGRLRVQEFIYALFTNDGTNEADASLLKENVFTQLANDLHSPKALAALFKFINENDASQLSKDSKKALIEFFSELNKIYKVWEIKEKEEVKVEIPIEIKTLAEQRLIAKLEKKWALADELRKKVSEMGYIIKDSKDGYTIEIHS